MSTTQVLVCCLLLVLACFVPNLVVHANHRTAQPWPILVDRYASCCTLLQHDISTDISLSYNELQSELSQLHPCVGKLHLEQSRLQQKYSTSTKSGVDARRSHGIAVVTMSMKSQGEHHIPQIELFSTYQRLVLGAYCEHRQYQYYDFETWQSSTPNEDGVLIEEVDVRWNKIMLLIEALHPVHGWARDVEAIVWIDSDAIVLDFALAIEDLLDEHHDADIIASADIKLGLINTGFFIVRNTHWARQVLQKWWTIADRKTVCDQDAFDQLYLQLLSESEEEYDMIQGKVKILSTDSINSHPPAWRYQSPSSRVLHLMGETAMFRAGIFRTGYQSICQARSGGFLSPQLSIYPETMIDLAKQIYKEETQFTFKQANETHTIDDIEALFKASHHYVDVLTFIATNQLKKKTLRQQYQTEVIHIREAVLKLTLHSVEVAKNQITSLSNMISEHHNRSKSLPPDEASPSKDTTTAQVDVLFQELLHQRAGQYNDIVTLQKKAAEAGNALYWAVTTLSDRQNIANLVFDILTDLENAVVEDSKFIPNHMRALMHQNLAMSYYEEAMRLQQETATLKTSSSAAATTTNTIRSHLSKALQHATSSVAIFEQYFQNTLEGSTMMEHLQSIQLQAGISCMMTQYMEAVSYWHAAIDKARRNTRGLHIGIHYERLAIVLYNAAICFMDAQDQLQSKEYALEAKKVVLQLIQANSNKLQTSSSQQEGDYQQVKEFKDLLKMIEDFLQQAEITMEDQRSHLLHRRERQGRAAAPVEVKPVQTPPSNKPSASQAQVHVPAKEGDLSLPAIKRIEDSSGKVKYVFDPQNGQNPEEDVDDDYEWEECTDLEEGCESFVVYDEVTPSSKDATVTIPASDKKKSQDIKSEVIAKEIDPRAAEAHLYEGLDEEEVLELMEVRKRYAHVTGMQDFFQELLTATPTESVAIQKEEKTVAICDCSQQEATIKALQQELHQAKLQQNMLQVKLDKIRKAFDLN